MTQANSNCWKVYFRKDDTEEWKWQSTYPAITITAVKRGDAEWDAPNEMLDPNEGRAAIQVLRNIRDYGYESIYRHEENDKPRTKSGQTILYHGQFD